MKLKFLPILSLVALGSISAQATEKENGQINEIKPYSIKVEILNAPILDGLYKKEKGVNLEKGFLTQKDRSFPLQHIDFSQKLNIQEFAIKCAKDRDLSKVTHQDIQHDVFTVILENLKIMPVGGRDGYDSRSSQHLRNLSKAIAKYEGLDFKGTEPKHRKDLLTIKGIFETLGYNPVVVNGAHTWHEYVLAFKESSTRFIVELNKDSEVEGENTGSVIESVEKGCKTQ